MDRDLSVRAGRVDAIDPVEEQAASDVTALVLELERTLDQRERHLLHRLRLCAETLGAVRASSMWRHGPLTAGRTERRS